MRRGFWTRIKKHEDPVIFGFAIAFFVLSMIPLLHISRYAVPGCDDYTYGVATHGAWVATHSLWEVLRAAFETTVEYWFRWQGTYSSIFLMTLHPGVLSESAYFLTTFLMAGMLGGGIVSLLHVVLKKYASVSSLYLRGTCIAVVLFLVFQTMAAPADGLYWYNGALHYVFMESVLFFQAAVLLSFCKAEETGAKTGYLLLSLLLAFVLGGANLITALQSCIVTTFLYAHALYLTGKDKKKLAAFLDLAASRGNDVSKKEEGITYLADADLSAHRQRLWVLLPLLVNLAGFALNVLAPGNGIRETTAEGMGAVKAILLSFYWAAVFVTEWLTPIVLAGFLLLCPVIWRMVEKAEAKFFRPLFAAALSFCVFAAMFTPTLYATSSEGPDRCKNVMRVVLYLLVFLNLVNAFGYYAGHRKENLVCELQRCVAKRYLSFVIVCAAAVGGIFLLAADKNTYTSVSAIRSLANGEAAEYYRQNAVRLALYNDPAKRNVTVEYLTAKPYLLFREDIGNEGSGEYWITMSIMDYYDKDSVFVREPGKK